MALASTMAAGICGAQSVSTFRLVPHGASEANLGYFPTPIKLSAAKPAQIKKEPKYAAKPQYGVITLGNGPSSSYVVALDEPAGGEWKIYIDRNRNGDLTDDGDGKWNKRTDDQGQIMYGPMLLQLNASYGSKTKQTSSSPYVIGINRVKGSPLLLTFRDSALKGVIKVAGKPHEALLIENDTDAVFSKSAAQGKKDENGRPLWLLVDEHDTGKFGTPIDVRSPFKLGDATYALSVSSDGRQVTLRASTAVAADPTKPLATVPLLSPGSQAPGFVAEKWGGGNLRLSDYRGKVVVLDFWATWCIPCRESMPLVESVREKAKGQDVVFISLCSWDEKDAYKRWVPKNLSRFGFQFAFDPHIDTDDSIAGNLYRATRLPTTYVIDKHGKVAAAFIGLNEHDQRLEDALHELGIKL